MAQSIIKLLTELTDTVGVTLTKPNRLAQPALALCPIDWVVQWPSSA